MLPQESKFDAKRFKERILGQRRVICATVIKIVGHDI